MPQKNAINTTSRGRSLVLPSISSWHALHANAPKMSSCFNAIPAPFRWASTVVSGMQLHTGRRTRHCWPLADSRRMLITSLRLSRISKRTIGRSEFSFPSHRLSEFHSRSNSDAVVLPCLIFSSTGDRLEYLFRKVRSDNFFLLCKSCPALRHRQRIQPTVCSQPDSQLLACTLDPIQVFTELGYRSPRCRSLGCNVVVN